MEHDNFQYTGQDILAAEDGSIIIAMEDYIQSLEDVKEIRKADKDKKFTKVEVKEYRKVTGKLSWLANSTRPDMSNSSLSISRKNNSATIADLRNISRILKKVKERLSRLRFLRIAEKEDLIILGIIQSQ